jgi:hypothetical protein
MGGFSSFAADDEAQSLRRVLHDTWQKLEMPVLELQ